jgi:hypothetical protein
MDDCIEAQWGVYIEYMRETLDYSITLIPLTITHTTKTKLMHPNSNIKNIIKACNS